MRSNPGRRRTDHNYSQPYQFLQAKPGRFLLTHCHQFVITKTSFDRMPAVFQEQ